MEIKNTNSNKTPPTDKANKLSAVFLIVALISIVFTVIKIPTNNKVEHAKSELNQMQHKIQTTKKSLSALKTENTKLSAESHVKPQTTPKPQSFDLQNAENKASDNLTKGIKLALGGYKDSDDFKKHQDDVINLVGKDLANTLYKMNGYGDSGYDLSDKRSFKFLLKNSTDAFVTFDNVDNVKDAKIIIMVKYDQTDGNSDKTVNTLHALITLHYDLVSQKCLSNNVVMFS